MTKDIKDYEGLYTVDTEGNIYSVRSKRNLSPWMQKSGYLQVALSKDGKVTKFYVHRLVAETFIPNPENKRTVNHKNEIKTDNSVDNLEWLTSRENNNYGTKQERTTTTMRKRAGKKVICVETGVVYNSLGEAAFYTGTDKANVSAVCHGRLKTTKGLHFKFMDSIEELINYLESVADIEYHKDGDRVVIDRINIAQFRDNPAEQKAALAVLESYNE